MSDNLSELLGRKKVDQSLFNKMGELAKPTGAPSDEELAILADDFLIGKANAFGTASFYDFLKPENKGKKVYVCNGTACVCAGTQDTVNKTLKNHFKEEEIGHMTCLGRCHENNAFHYNGKNYSGDALQNLDIIINSKNELNQDSYNVKASGKAVLTESFTTIADFYKPFIGALQKDSEEILEEIKTSNVRGRGGAGFPMGLKLEFCRNVENTTKFIICNADEGDPGAFSDRYLLEHRPHSVLFGMLISGYVTHASYGIVYIRAEYPEAVKIVQDAIDDLRNEGLIGNNINDSGFSFDFKIIQAQGSYICGEETALINSIEGQRPEVRVRPPYPAQKGLFNKPTVVNNVETLAALHYIISNGGSTWKQIGTERSSGTKLVSLDSFFNKPGLYEVEMGTPLSVVINDLGGGFKSEVKALQIGGPLGGVVPVSKINDLTIDFESFSKEGFLLGHASIICIPSSFPMMKFIEHLFDFAAYESCGKCFPCRLGTKRGHELSTKALHAGHKIDQKLFTDLLTTLEQGSLCAHGGGIPLPIRNTLHYFEDELKMYFN
ncbi:NADH-quinone oxidoreductase subunit F [Aquimarina sp. EL_43]|uniref:NADH-ubiquinone oxidoreductase-F iron-sulfur binding region domain-containing protein n=1 Tax=Aquimarina TaxID=290174 RepID=UPI0004727937|nr:MULTISPECIES: NADH-ubiquinone oxidoreductase-F iron-sulfur binding region domain-containing protein [Aquimarina]MBG6129827.1 NADH-quinone oxidoreductase subunit F [Aquimarina sp. EL_35]MBG6150892.1 NADH-quinone oxidoreductase subunit F [Aquimarina sp. EL_32]MBG6167801.1 NADH-quinone oxidoreductase subunit F [Aquimarina sp. EL_43]